jgi:hypothetical protein
MKIYKNKGKKQYSRTNKHGFRWTKTKHYGNCGQNCPCCRFFVESLNSPDPKTWFGVCKVCARASKIKY